jgi:hypothetical protein
LVATAIEDFRRHSVRIDRWGWFIGTGSLIVTTWRRSVMKADSVGLKTGCRGLACGYHVVRVFRRSLDGEQQHLFTECSFEIRV